jgi:mRNA interferase MazF
MNPGDIYWVELPHASGHEQAGRRPALVLQDESYSGGLPLVIVVPLTGATSAARFAGTLTIEPDETNHLNRASVALVFQIRAVDCRIVQEKIGEITSEQLAEIYALLDRLTGHNITTALKDESDEEGSET